MSHQPPDSYTLSQILGHLNRVVAQNLPQALWVRAELQQIQENRGIFYLNLVEYNDNRQAQAQIQAMIWRKDWQILVNKYGQDNLNRALMVGRSILVLVKFKYSELYGLKVLIQDLDCQYILGLAQWQRQTDVDVLQAEGLLNKQEQKTLPLVLQRLAIISSERAAGLQDFLKHLEEELQAYHLELKLFPSAVQGRHAVQELSLALAQVEQEAQQFDAVLILRGGGSRGDLSAFDDLELARQIARHPLPVLTGIGHDSDQSLADVLAHRAFKTPTALAAFVVNRMQDFYFKVNDTYDKIEALIYQYLLVQEGKIHHLKQAWQKAVHRAFEFRAQQLAGLEARWALLDPLETLKRGYTVVLDGRGRWLKGKPEELDPPMMLKIIWHDGDSLAYHAE